MSANIQRGDNHTLHHSKYKDKMISLRSTINNIKSEFSDKKRIICTNERINNLTDNELQNCNIEIGESKRTQKYIPLTRYIENQTLEQDEADNHDNYDKEISSFRQNAKFNTEEKEFNQNVNDNSGRLSFGQFMDSFEQQKEEIVREWMKKNNVDFFEQTSQFEPNIAKKEYEIPDYLLNQDKESKLKDQEFSIRGTNLEKEVIREILLNQLKKLDQHQDCESKLQAEVNLLKTELESIRKEFKKKISQCDSLTKEVHNLKGKVRAYQKMLKQQKGFQNNYDLEVESLKDQLDNEVTKRTKIEKKVRKFIKWLHKDQKIYIENLISKLGIEEVRKSKHRRSSSCCSNNQFKMIHSQNSNRASPFDSRKEAPSMNSISSNRFIRKVFSPGNIDSSQRILSNNKENISCNQMYPSFVSESKDVSQSYKPRLYSVRKKIKKSRKYCKN
ncbi:unnamed protein product [Moneuplotes crassus]|uniref:Uncharacterized protein n=1 Tax=Euplotes crassus TaxID=5936 RepID=A0AAD1UHE9_EUPCR|nr:unnamed protein product [Moneuplotes crassus]